MGFAQSLTVDFNPTHTLHPRSALTSIPKATVYISSHSIPLPVIHPEFILMGIPAGVRFPKSSLVVVAVYVLCSVINATTETFRRLRSIIPRALPSLSSVNWAQKGARSGWKAQPWFRMEGVCVVCQVEVVAEDEVSELRECLHSFHKDCLDGWIEKGHRTCPLCRTQF